MAKTDNKALNEARLAVVDTLYRQGQSVFQIATFLLTTESYTEAGYDNGLAAKIDITFPEKIQRLSQTIRNAIAVIEMRYKPPVALDDRKRALEEYVNREDGFFSEAWRIAHTSFDNRDKIAALRLAQESAQNKARALGVVLTPDPDALPLMNQGLNSVTVNNIGQIVNLASTALAAQLEKPQDIKVLDGEVSSPQRRSTHNRKD